MTSNGEMTSKKVVVLYEISNFSVQTFFFMILLMVSKILITLLTNVDKKL
jgi:hypothetical protein